MNKHELAVSHAEILSSKVKIEMNEKKDGYKFTFPSGQFYIGSTRNIDESIVELNQYFARSCFLNMCKTGEDK